NATLATVDTLDKSLVCRRPIALSTEERGRLLKLGTDLEAAWRHPSATAAVTRERIIRVVLRGVSPRVEDAKIIMAALGLECATSSPVRATTAAVGSRAMRGLLTGIEGVNSCRCGGSTRWASRRALDSPCSIDVRRQRGSCTSDPGRVRATRRAVDALR